MRYLPMVSSSAIRDRVKDGGPLASSTLFFEHLHCLHQARFHARQRLAEDTDFVLAAGDELAGLQIAKTHFVGDFRESLHTPDDDRVQHQVEHDKRDHEYRRQRKHEDTERVIGALDRHYAWDRNDLRTDNIV